LPIVGVFLYDVVGVGRMLWANDLRMFVCLGVIRMSNGCVFQLVGAECCFGEKLMVIESSLVNG
jgi:hypothetical protein